METSRGLTILERQVLSLIHQEIFGCDKAFYAASANDFTSTLGIFTSGGTLANVSAMWAAWQNSQYKNNEKHDKLVVIGSELMHYSFDKAAEILGLELVRLPVNKDNVISVQDIAHTIAACGKADKKVIALVGIAGTTDFGSIDPLADICRLGKEHGIYVHIDAAWGGGFVLSDYKDKVLAGIADADSVTIDGHKQLMTPIGCGLLLFKTPELSKATAHYAPYAVREKSLDQGKYTLEGTRPANVLYLHACLNLIGRNGYAEIFRSAMDNAAYMAQRIVDSDAFELMTTQHINIFTYRYIPPAFRNKQLTVEDNNEINRINELLQKKQRAIGNSFVSRTTRAIGKYGTQKLILLRAVLLNPMTTQSDIDFVLNDQLEIARTLGK
jgi:glutamate decarboxylase